MLYILFLECPVDNTIWLTDDGEVLGCIFIQLTQNAIAPVARKNCKKLFGSSATLLKIDSEEKNELWNAHRRYSGLFPP